jgi:hypothetical protein
VIFCEASNWRPTKSSSFFIFPSFSYFFLSCCATIFLTFSALPQNSLFTCRDKSKDIFLIFFSSSLTFCSFICYSLLKVDWANLQIFFLSLYLSSRSDAKSFPTSYTCLSKYFHLIPFCVGSSSLYIFLPN